MYNLKTVFENENEFKGTLNNIFTSLQIALFKVYN